MQIVCFLQESFFYANLTAINFDITFISENITEYISRFFLFYCVQYYKFLFKLFQQQNYILVSMHNFKIIERISFQSGVGLPTL